MKCPAPAALAWLAAAPGGAWATALPAESGICQRAASQAEAALRIPDAFLSAIARVESGRPDAASGALVAWPWTIDVGGDGHFFATKTEAVAAVRALQARGVTSIDVGCLQVNLAQHPDAFASLEQAFDPDANARFAAGFLSGLFAQTRSWPLAAAAYHSQTPSLGSAYQRRVLAEWAVPDGQPNPARQAAGVARGGMAPPTQADAAPAGAAAAPAFGRAEVASPHLLGAAAAPSSVWPATGRGLSAYRSMPTRLALTPLKRPPS